MKDWMACKHFSLTDGGRVGLCDLVPEEEWGLCYWDLDAEDLCPKPDDVPERESGGRGLEGGNVLCGMSSL